MEWASGEMLSEIAGMSLMFVHAQEVCLGLSVAGLVFVLSFPCLCPEQRSLYEPQERCNVFLRFRLA